MKSYRSHASAWEVTGCRPTRRIARNIFYQQNKARWFEALTPQQLRSVLTGSLDICYPEPECRP